MKLGIIGAMDVEVATLKEKMENCTQREVAGSVFWEGTLSGLPVVVVQCGVGKVNAALCVQVLADCFGVTHVSIPVLPAACPRSWTSVTWSSAPRPFTTILTAM